MNCQFPLRNHFINVHDFLLIVAGSFIRAVSHSFVNPFSHSFFLLSMVVYPENRVILYEDLAQFS